jgi:hypothetical protein
MREKLIKLLQAKIGLYPRLQKAVKAGDRKEAKQIHETMDELQHQIEALEDEYLKKVENELKKK